MGAAAAGEPGGGLARRAGLTLGREAVRQVVVHSSGVRILMALDHRSSISLMLVDPEGNNVEVYWATGRPTEGLYAAPIDLDRPAAELVEQFDG